MSFKIQNPVLPGFHPDPSIVRVGDEYFLATSTFEWWPGVPIYRSRDLKNWSLVGHALTRPSQLNLRGVPDSAGVWAPSLTHADGKFWLVYSEVRNTGGGRPFKDLHNYLITADRVEGPWSDPVYLNATGFDASLFHDTDGRKWVVQMRWDFRPDHPRFAGIVVQEFDPKEMRLAGDVRTLLRKERLVEGPNLYRHGKYVYLMLAEGGTGWNHGIAMARAREVTGPYELDPVDSVLTTRDDDSVPLQKAGHGELVESPRGEWFMVHLASRPVGTGDQRRCVLGRETCIQRVEWTPDGWLRLAQGGHHPAVEIDGPAGVVPSEPEVLPAKDNFDRPDLDPRWCALRAPIDPSWATLSERPGWLRLRGRESLHSLFEQSLVARRLQSSRWRAETRLAFDPHNFTHSAGLIVWYDTRTHYYLRVTWSEGGRILGVALSDDGAYAEPKDSQLALAPGDVSLRAEGDGATLRFSYAQDGAAWRPVGQSLDLTKVSDDYGSVLHFTGAFVGLCAQDLDGTRKEADFDYFVLEQPPASD